jgi:ABC-type transporter Mla subunit MlaD
MSARANYFKLGLFVIAAAVSLVVLLIIVGSGRVFQQKITIETYFNESVQGLDIGSKVKYRGVVIGEVTRISFTYVKYQQDKPMSERLRYVLVEAQLQPKLLGGRVATEITGPESMPAEVERGLRVRSAPQGITGTNYLEIDYIDPPPPLLPIDWTPEYAYIPSAASTVTALINSASEIMDRLHKLDVEGTLANFNTLMITTNKRIDELDTKALTERTLRTLAKVESALDNLNVKKLSDEGVALLAELRATNADLKKTLGNPTLQKLPEDAHQALVSMNETLASTKALVGDPKLAKSIASLERAIGRLDRILGGGETDLASTIDNLRQITDNLRELTDDTKRYPANVIFGSPPPPLERKP